MLKKKSKASGFAPDLSAQRSMSIEGEEMPWAFNVSRKSRSDGVVDVDAREVNVGKAMGVGEKNIQEGLDGAEGEATQTSGAEGKEDSSAEVMASMDSDGVLVRLIVEERAIRRRGATGQWLQAVEPASDIARYWSWPSEHANGVAKRRESGRVSGVVHCGC
ncbi:unnamed protein product [Ilex paraguariensis]|uniref:Uncharacterized protein n=1 Tax=Ilex paraguariensis TaxID=185542 RepID=A0ABC8TNR6_9AQUA